jgi:hypothetical protein
MKAILSLICDDRLPGQPPYTAHSGEPGAKIFRMLEQFCAKEWPAFAFPARPRLHRLTLLAAGETKEFRMDTA